MNEIVANYNSLVKKYRDIEKESTEQEIHDKRVILRRVFPILSAFKIKPGKVKNGEKTFELFGKLRDVQVQIIKLESSKQNSGTALYLTFLKEKELKLKEKVQRISKKKRIGFPKIEKSSINLAKLNRKAEKLLNKLVDKAKTLPIDDASDIHQIRIKFKKYRYTIEMLSSLEKIEEEKIEKMKPYQDLLGEIQDYDVLIEGIRTFYRKRKLNEEVNIDAFELNQNTLIEKFDNELEMFISVCREVVNQENGVISESMEHKTDNLKFTK